MLEYENNLYNEGVALVAGVDEVGRGPLIGPVVACACILPVNFYHKDIKDSKKLSEKKREEMYKIIKENALAIGLGIVSPDGKILKKVEEIITYIEKNNIEEFLVNTIIKGDAKSESIAAASIIAKVTRDHMLDEMDKEYPMYDLKNNKGYGTKKHLEALQTYGPCKYHRVSYSPVRNALNEKNTKTIENNVNV